MDWLNIHVSTLDGSELVGAEPVDRATWLFLFRYCVGQENDGIIRDCAQWGDRKWQQIARVTLREVKRETELWRWEGRDLHVKFYPLKKQQEVQAKRQGGKDGAAKRWSKQDGSKPESDSSAIAELCSEQYAEGKRNGMEGEGRARDPTPLIKGKETEQQWLDRLRKQFDGIDVDAELTKARKKKRKEGERLDRAYFENVWLKMAGEPVSEANTSNVAPPITEPDGWRSWLERTYPNCGFVADGKCVADRFGQLPTSVQAEAVAALKKAS